MVLSILYSCNCKHVKIILVFLFDVPPHCLYAMFTCQKLLYEVRVGMDLLCLVMYVAGHLTGTCRIDILWVWGKSSASTEDWDTLRLLRLSFCPLRMSRRLRQTFHVLSSLVTLLGFLTLKVYHAYQCSN